MKVNIHWHKMGNALASICGTLLLLTPLVTTGGLANGIVTGKVFWFHGVTTLSAVLTVAIAACRCPEEWQAPSDFKTYENGNHGHRFSPLHSRPRAAARNAPRVRNPLQSAQHHP